MTTTTLQTTTEPLEKKRRLERKKKIGKPQRSKKFKKENRVTQIPK